MQYAVETCAINFISNSTYKTEEIDLHWVQHYGRIHMDIHFLLSKSKSLVVLCHFKQYSKCAWYVLDLIMNIVLSL